MLAWPAWQQQYSLTAYGTLRKQFTKPFSKPAAPDCTGMAKKAGPRLRDQASWLPLAVWMRSRNLVTSFSTIPVQAFSFLVLTSPIPAPAAAAALKAAAASFAPPRGFRPNRPPPPSRRPSTSTGRILQSRNVPFTNQISGIWSSVKRDLA